MRLNAPALALIAPIGVVIIQNGACASDLFSD
jgi:hypothetical protein